MAGNLDARVCRKQGCTFSYTALKQIIYMKTLSNAYLHIFQMRLLHIDA